MQGKLSGDKLRRVRVAVVERSRRRLKAAIRNARLKEVSRMEKASTSSSKPRSGSLTRIRSRCTVTGRGRGVDSRSRSSRSALRRASLQGQVPGWIKCSW